MEQRSYSPILFLIIFLTNTLCAATPPKKANTAPTKPNMNSISENMDGPTVQTASDGTKIINNPDGSSVQIHPDGSLYVVNSDGSTIQKNADGSEVDNRI